jgi:predicted MFS family arabinose efflux permease
MIALQIAAFLVTAEARVIAPLLPAVSTEFGVSVASAGHLVTWYAIPYGLFQLVYGPLADRYSRQKVMGVALGLFAFGTFVAGFMPNLVSLVLVRFATGAAAAGVIPVSFAYIGDAVPYEKRQAALGHIVSAGALGGVVSAAMGGVVASLVSWRWLFWGYGVVALAAAALLLKIPSRPAAAHAAPGSLLGPYAEIFRAAGGRALWFYALVLFEGFALLSTSSYFGALLFERNHLNYATIGFLLMIGAVAGSITARGVGRLVARFGERNLLLAGGLMMTVQYLILWQDPVWFFVPFAMLLGGSGFILAHSTLQARATELVPARRGTAMAIFAFSLFLGGGIGAWAAGAAIDRFHYVPAMIATAVAVAIFTAAAPRLALAPRTEPEPRDAPAPVAVE